ncbi:MAG: tRNA (adenosine(37)-N6)-threonylcarbamoyltransferase complex dimerization subunit type 1 TsaB [Lachnospiraceae bacterium]|nr:tRNA (adenosine(37)-N6)-threonylcarbamoyltransferase complex dimerization subunit type 1 TsaB [Lachnospiraceae bacterium]
MKIIGIDSSGLVASVAIYSDGVIIAEYTTNFKKTHSQTLLPMLDEIKKMTDLDLESVDAIAIASGPGSYTGLRIGSATAKGIALVIDKPIVEVPTLEGLAYNFWGTGDLVCPLMDARRGQVYTGLYEFNPELGTVVDGSAIPLTDMVEKINEIGRPVIYLGDGVPVYKEVLKEKTKVPYLFAPAHRAYQSAASVATLGALYYSQNKYVNADDHAPTYLRKSQAENEGPKQFEV